MLSVVLCVGLCVAPLSYGKDAAVTENLLRLATTEQFAPYAYQQNDKSWVGIDVDIVSAVLKQVGINFKIGAFPRARITIMLNTPSLDGLLSTAPYNEEVVLKQLWQSTPIYYSEVSVFALDTFPAEALQGKDFLLNPRNRLGVLDEFSYVVDGQELANRANLIKVQRDQQLIDLLSIGRVDLVISEDISFIYTARSVGRFDHLKPLLEITSRPVSIALDRKVIEQRPGLSEKINQSILQLQQSGFIDSVIVKYLTIE
jgi:polar amino acid transport system substrate-binding protein